MSLVTRVYFHTETTQSLKVHDPTEDRSRELRRVRGSHWEPAEVDEFDVCLTLVKQKEYKNFGDRTIRLIFI